MEAELNSMRNVAVRLAREAGRYAVAELEGNLGIEVKGNGSDVVTRVDHEAERRIVAGIRDAFPDHAILGEESGRHGDRDAAVRWLVDPLDGTNNYVMDLSMFGVCLTACLGDEPVVAVVHDSVRDITTSAIRDGGATRGERRLTLGEAPPLNRSTLSWTQGYAVSYDDPFRTRAMESMERATKRVLRTWSPSIDWGLVAAGHIGAFVAYRNEVWDLLGGALIVQEAGGVVHHAPDYDCVIAGHADTVLELRSLLGV
ncbi:MAG TPA: inositol monophosphatase family protein [Thermomicrobiales bacterium]|nr:inositol monophosphatase family protein [Thermomicrobiales bacterium]